MSKTMSTRRAGHVQRIEAGAHANPNCFIGSSMPIAEMTHNPGSRVARSMGPALHFSTDDDGTAL
jgi:hypothetical protein